MQYHEHLLERAWPQNGIPYTKGAGRPAHKESEQQQDMLHSFV